MKLSTSDIIQIISIITSSLLTVVTAVIAYKTLKTTNKSIDEANRPVVVAYEDQVQSLISIHAYLIIKNFGNTPALIDSINVEPPISTASQSVTTNFSNSKNTILAPNQSINMVFSSDVYGDAYKNLPEHNILINYHSGERYFTDTFTLTHKSVFDVNFIKTKPSKNKTIEEIITRVSEEFLRKNL